jgi:hypothetical protein
VERSGICGQKSRQIGGDAVVDSSNFLGQLNNHYGKPPHYPCCSQFFLSDAIDDGVKVFLGVNRRVFLTTACLTTIEGSVFNILRG